MPDMDWTSIINTTITGLLAGGGLVTLFTLQDKRYAAMLENITKLIDQWQEIANDRKARAEELKKDLDKKDDKIDALYVELNEVRTQLDHTRTAEAVAKTMRCDKIECLDRKPPFGTQTNNKCHEKEQDNH